MNSPNSAAGTDCKKSFTTTACSHFNTNKYPRYSNPMTENNKNRMNIA